MLRVLCFTLMLSLAALAQGKKPEVHLNHAFIVPDAETYEAIRNSGFVKQFAVWEERTTHRKDITYTGFYLYGRHTYFEFLRPEDPKAIGGSDIAFGVDRSGDIDLLQKRAEVAGIKTEIQPITRAFNGKDVGWFRSLKRKDEGAPSLGIWTLEYQPTFLNEWNPASMRINSVRREDVLARYATAVKQKQQEKAVADVVDIWVALPAASVAESLRECGVLGLKVSRPGKEATCSDGQTSIHLTESSTALGIAAIRFALAKDAGQSKHQLGHTTLEIKGRFAVWSFTPNNQR